MLPLSFLQTITRYLCKQCRSRWASSYRADPLGSTLFSFLVLILDWSPCLHQWTSKFKGRRVQFRNRVKGIRNRWMFLQRWMVRTVDRISCNIRKHTVWHVRPPKIQISLRFCNPKCTHWSFIGCILDSTGCKVSSCVQHRLIRLPW